MVTYINPATISPETNLQFPLVDALFQADPEHPGLPSTVGDLPTFDFRVGPHEPTQAVVKQLEQRPELPGVLIIEGEQYIGMVSRKKCLELLSRPYGTEVFLNRGIIVLYTQLGAEIEPIPADTRVDRAVQIALSRHPNQLYEPVIVQFADRRIKLLDLHVLLLAQSYLLANANSLIEQQIKIGRALSRTLDLDEVLDLILKHMAEIVPYDRVSIMLEKGDEMEIVAARGFPSDMSPGQLRITIKESDVYRQIYHTKEPLSIPDVSQRPDWHYVEGLPRARAWMGTPLIHSDKVIGMLSLTRVVADDFSQDEVALAQTFAGQAAIALQNARLYDEIKRFNQDLEGMVQERTEALQAAYDKLERLDRSKSDFIGVASHELRTPLTVMSGYTQMLQGDPVIKKDKNRLSIVSGIYTGIQRLHEIVTSMLDVAKIDQSELQLCHAPVQLAELVEELQGVTAPLAKQRKLSLTVHDMSRVPVIEGDSEALYKVFYNLITNAIKFTPDGGQINVSGRAMAGDQNELGEHAVLLVVADSGIGIDPEHQELIFEKFYQTGQVSLHSSGKVKFKGGGPGLGLAIARGIVQAHGGRIWVESPGHDEQTCPGSRFHVLLPLTCRCLPEQA